MDYDVTLRDSTAVDSRGDALHQNNSTMFWVLSCDGNLVPSQHLLFHLANVCFLVSYLSPSKLRGLLFTHSLLVVAFLIYSTWAWNVICSPEVFAWNFTFMLLNMGQTLYVVYQLRTVTIPKELEPLYQELFEPLQVPRILFKRLVSAEFAQTVTLHAGEAYALCNLTKADRLGLLIEGRVSVLSSTHFLHSISPMEFLDSPEFESCRTSVEDKFKVSVIAVTNCRYIYWPRATLEFFFVKEPYIATVMAALIARDITSKLYRMNHKIVTEKGSQLDIRLPSLTSSLSSSIGENLPNKTYGKSKNVVPRQKSSLSLASSLPIFEYHSQLSLRASPEAIHFGKNNRRRMSSYTYSSSPPFRPHGFQQKLHSGLSRNLIRPTGIPSYKYTCAGVTSPFESELELNEEDENEEPLLEIHEEYI